MCALAPQDHYTVAIKALHSSHLQRNTNTDWMLLLLLYNKMFLEYQSFEVRPLSAVVSGGYSSIIT